VQGSKVVGAIAQKWHTLLGEVGEGELAELSFGQRLAGIGIQNLWIE
jgi:hypothetical protein